MLLAGDDKRTQEQRRPPGNAGRHWGHLGVVLEDGDLELISHALGAVAHSKGMTEIARRTGMGRQSL